MEGELKGSISLKKTSSLPHPSRSHSSLKKEKEKKLKEEDERLDLLQNGSYGFHNDASATQNSTKKGGDEKEEDEEEKVKDDGSEDFDFLKHRDKGSFDVVPDLENQSYSAMNRVSAKESELVRRYKSEDGQIPRGIGGGVSGMEDDQVTRCSANSSFQRKNKPVLMRTRTKSRLMDPPPTQRVSGRVENRSGFLGKSGNIEEDDPFHDDLPEEFRKRKISFLIVIQWLSLIFIVTALICSLVIKKLKAKTVWGMQLWKWEVVSLVLVCGGLISGWLIRIVVFFIERDAMLRKRVLYFVYSLKSSVQRFLWLGWGLLAWVLILDKRIRNERNSHVLPYVTKMLICFMVATLLWFIKTLLLKVLTMNFHVSAFFDRIQDALFNQYVIETLSGPAHLELQRMQEEEEEVMCEVRELQNAGFDVPADIRANCLSNKGRGFGSGRSFGSGLPPKSPQSSMLGKSPQSSMLGKGSRVLKSPLKKIDEGSNKVDISIDHLHRWTRDNISAWNMKRLMSMVRKGVLTTLDEQVDQALDDDNAVQIRSEKEAKLAAKRVFINVARPRSRHIYLEDLMRFLGEEEASRTINQFESAGDGKGITKRALKNWVVNVFRERRALALSLTDTKTAVHKLQYLVNVLVGVAVIIIWLLILGVSITHFLVFVSSQVVVMAVMFGNTCKTTFEAIIFLFIMHPFDVGDRCEIEGVQMVVEEMNILTTVFLRYDNQKIIYPNAILATKAISNYYRSPDMGDAVDFCVHISTPVEKISLMKERITRYIENKEDHWYPDPMLVMRDVEDMNKIMFSVWLSHTMNHQDMGERYVRRSLLVEEMVKIFKSLEIEYRMLPTDVNVRKMPALVSDRLPSNWTTSAR